MDYETIDSDLGDEILEVAMKRYEDGGIPEEAFPDRDIYSPTIAQYVRAHLRVPGSADSVDKTIKEIMEVSKGDELLTRRLQTDPGIRQWWREALANMAGIELERRIQAGELVREGRGDGGTHVRRV